MFKKVSTTVSVSPVNQKIKVLLKKKKKTIKQLAAMLDADYTRVRRQLNSHETFKHSELIKICSFLNQLPTDFFYDRQPDPVSPFVKELKRSAVSIGARIQETQKLMVNFFAGHVIYN